MLGGSQASRMMNKSKTTLRPNQKRKTLADIISTNKENKKKPEQETFDLSFDKIADDVELIVNEFVGCVGYIYPEGYVTDHGNLEHLVKKDTEPEPVVEKKKAIVETPTKQKPMMKVTPAPIMNIDYMQILREIEEKNQQKEAKKVMQKLKREKKKQLEEMQLEMLRAKMATEAAKELETLKTTKSQKKVVEASPKPAEALPSTSSEGGSPVKKRGRGRPKKTEAEKEETRQKKQIQVQVGDSLMMCDVEDGKEPSSQSEEESEEEDSEKEDSEEETQYKPEDVSLKKKRGRPSKKQVPIQIGDNVMLCDVDEGEQEVAELDEVRAVVNEDQEMEGDGEFEPKVKVEKLDTCEYLEPDCIDCKMCDARFGSAALLRSHVRSEHLGIPLEKDLPLDTPDGIVEDEEEDEDVEYVEEEEEEEEENVEEEDEATDQEVLKKLMKKQKKEAKKAKKRQRSGGDKEEKELQPKKRRKKSEKVLGKELKKQKLEEARLAAEANEGAVDDALNSTLEDSMVDGEQPEGSQAQSNKEKKERKDRKKKRDSSRVDQKRFLYPPFTVPEECAKGNAVFDDQGTVKSFVCHFCERTIKVNTRGGYLSVYKEHIKTHTQEKEFKCPLCDYESHREREVRKHVSRKHEDVDAEELVPRRSLQARPISIASGNYVTPLNSITMTQDEIDAQEEEFLAKTLEEPLLQRKRGRSRVEEVEVEKESQEEDEEEDELNESIEYPPEGQEFKVEEDGSVVKKEEMKGELIEEGMEEEEDEEEVPDELPVFYEETEPAVDLAEACGEEEVQDSAVDPEEAEIAEEAEEMEEAEEAEEAEESSSQLSTEQILDSALDSMDEESVVVEAEEDVQTTEEILDEALDSPAINGSTESQSVMEVLNLTSKS